MKRQLVIRIAIDDCPPEIAPENELDYLMDLLCADPPLMLDGAESEIIEEEKDDRNERIEGGIAGHTTTR